MSTLEELHSKVEELTAQVDEKKDEVKDKDAKHKAEMDEKEKEHKSAMDEKEHEEKEAMDKENEKHESSYKSVYSKMKSAMEEETDEKKKEGMKAALKAMEEEHKKADMNNPKEYERKGKSAEDEKKEREHEAQITYLTAQIITPKINQLEILYKASKTPEAKIKEYKALWEKSTGLQLDAEIEKISGILGSTLDTIYEAQNSAFGFSTTSSLKKNHQFDASKFSTKIDKMSDSQLFNTGIN